MAGAVRSQPSANLPKVANDAFVSIRSWVRSFPPTTDQGLPGNPAYSSRRQLVALVGIVSAIGFATVACEIVSCAKGIAPRATKIALHMQTMVRRIVMK